MALSVGHSCSRRFIGAGQKRQDEKGLGREKGRTTDFFPGPRLSHKCGVPVGFGTPHSCGSEAPKREWPGRQSQNENCWVLDGKKDAGGRVAFTQGGGPPALRSGGPCPGISTIALEALYWGA
jgi:hypothetical protein